MVTKTKTTKTRPAGYTVEDALHAVEDRAVLLGFLAGAIRDVNDAPTPAFFAGLAAMLGETAETVRAVRHAIDVQALDTPIGARRS